MKATRALGIAMLITGLPLAAAAQSSPSPGGRELEMKTKERRSIVLPKPSPEQIRQDADAAVNDYAATKSPGKVVRETSPVRPSARPDLDADVRSGIQSQRLNDALRRR